MPGIVAVIHPACSAPGDDLTAYPQPPAEIAAEAAERLTAHLRPGEVISATADGRLVMRLRREDRGARPVRLQEMAYHAIEAFDRLGHTAGTVDLGVGWARVSRKQRPRAGPGVRRGRRQRVDPPARPAAAVSRAGT